MKKTRPNTFPKTRAEGFTLTELLVVMVTIGILSALLLPALAGTKPDSQAFQCLHNERQLLRAWRMYAEDNSDVLVPSLHGSYTQGGNFDPVIGGPGWVQGWLDWTLLSDNTNTAFLINARLAAYLAHSASVFKCPADNYLSAVQRMVGWTQRCRSYSENIGIGQGNAEMGPWSAIYKHCTKLQEIPSPANTWVFIEEHPDSINDPGFFNPQTATIMTDTPSTLHNGACNLSFADGHAEIHQWQGCLTSTRALQVHAKDGDYLNNVISANVGDPDIHYLSSHACLANPNVSY